MGDFGDDPSASAGDLAYITDDISEQDKVYELSDPFETIGKKISIIIPKAKKFVITRISLAPTKAPTVIKCDADIIFADRLIGNLFYDTSSSNFAHDYIKPLSLHGDGIRKLEIDVTRFYENITSHENYMRIILMGFYKDISDYTPFQIKKIRAIEQDADTILLYWDAPLDNGGKPIIGYKIIFSKNPDMSDSVELYSKYTQQGNPKEIEIMCTHGGASTPLDDNTTYYYKVYPVTAGDTVEVESASPVVSATTHVDIPHKPVLTLTKISENQVLIEINNDNIDTGGVPLDGLKIQRKDGSESTYRTIQENTKTITYVDTIIPQIKSTYVVSVINNAGKTSIPSDPQSVTLTWNSPVLQVIVFDNLGNPIIQFTDPGTATKFGVDYYLIERSFKESGEWSQIIQVKGSDNSWTDKTTQPVKDYSYRVRLSRNNTLSSYSNVESISMPSRIPDAPQNLRITKTSDIYVDLEWDTIINDGGNPTVGYKIEYDTSEHFAFPTTITSNNLNTKYQISSLLPKTTYYFRVYAYNEKYISNNPTSYTVSTKTTPTIFGVTDVDFVVAQNTKVTLNAGELFEYRDLTIEDGGILEVNGAIIKVRRNYTQNGTGKIVVLANGCAGGKGGTTHAGRGGAQTTGYRGGSNPGSSAGKSPATIITKSCTTRIVAEELLTKITKSSFISKFRSIINGGKGSSGTEAQTSGNGGNSGGGGRWANSWHPGLRGGNGGKAANGVDGVRGGGKLALFINNIISTITIEAKGLPGINGIKGTGTPGTAGRRSSSNSRFSGKNGGGASGTGTLGSSGSDGGIVYLLYDTAPDGYIPIADVTGGLGGYNGGNSTGPHPLTTRANSGIDGLSLVIQLDAL